MNRIGRGGPWLVHGRIETPAQKYVPPSVIEPTYWTNKYQGGALDLPVNIALIALTVVGATLFSNRPTPPPSAEITSPYIYPNLAAKTEKVPVPRAPLYITRPTPPPSPQIDVYPNISIHEIESRALAGQYFDPPQFQRLAPVPELFPNLAVNPQTQALRLAGLYIEPEKYRKLTPAPDLYPNIASNLAPALAAPIIRAPIYVTKSWKGWPTPDLYPNVALILADLVTLGNATTWTDLPSRPQPPIDLYPNLAARQLPLSRFQPLIDPQLWRQAALPPELFPNVAIRAGSAAVLILPMIEPSYTSKYRPQSDYFPNIAIGVSPSPVLILPMVEPIYRYRYAVQSDYFPNLAVTAPISVIPPLTPALTQAILNAYPVLREGSIAIVSRASGNIFLASRSGGIYVVLRSNKWNQPIN